MRILRRLGRLVLLAIGFTVIVLIATLLPFFEPYRDAFVIVMVIMAPVVLYVELRRRNRQDSINGNLLLIRESLTEIREVMRDSSWDSMPRRVRVRIIRSEDRLGTVATYYQGFRALAETKRELLKEAGLLDEDDAA